MKIDSIGCGYRHDEEFEMNCPSGIGCWLLLLVKTPAAFYIGEREYRTESNSFVLLSPKIPVKYSGNGGCYEDDWLFFGGWSPYEDYFSQMGIPINTVIESKNLDEASGIMRIMSYEHYSNDKFTEKMEDHYMEILFMKLARIASGIPQPSPNLSASGSENLIRLRTELYSFPERAKSIDELAEAVGMSRSGLQHRYKRMFGTSITEDAISGRIQRASQLLSATMLTVSEIAYRCGYANEYTFMRQFRERTGMTPTQYRRSGVRGFD
ncbi:MAG: AraC family transcriptional regulator [Oscillospiraceae bacterium]|nr:AraC family transcriptional regulator [Oscillospiraceae bacterium]